MTKHEGLRAWAKRCRTTDIRLLRSMCRDKRVLRILIIQVDLGAEL